LDAEIHEEMGKIWARFQPSLGGGRSWLKMQIPETLETLEMCLFSLITKQPKVGNYTLLLQHQTP
jgi:hypothetical protein